MASRLRAYCSLWSYWRSQRGTIAISAATTVLVSQSAALFSKTSRPSAIVGASNIDRYRHDHALCSRSRRNRTPSVNRRQALKAYWLVLRHCILGETKAAVSTPKAAAEEKSRASFWLVSWSERAKGNEMPPSTPDTETIHSPIAAFLFRCSSTSSCLGLSKKGVALDWRIRVCLPVLNRP